MIGFLFKFWKKKPVPVTTIPLSELANIWRDPVEPEEVVKKEKMPESKPMDESVKTEPSTVDLTTLIGVDKNPRANNNDAWFDKAAMLATLQSRISEGRTSAFVYQGITYYTLQIVSRALNEQRRSHHIKPLTPNEVIAFFKSGKKHGFKSGKYLLRFDKGLPVKVYLYTHPIADGGLPLPEPPLPVDETGRRLKSLKPVKE